MVVYPSSPSVLRAMQLFRVDFVCDVVFDFPVAAMKYSDKQLKGKRAYMAFDYRLQSIKQESHSIRTLRILVT